MNWLSIVGYSYGLLNIIFGYLGWANKGSVPSLVAGTTAGILALLGTVLAKKQSIAGYLLLTAVGIAIILRFLPPYLRDTSKIYPNLILILASIVLLGCTLEEYLSSRRG